MSTPDPIRQAVAFRTWTRLLAMPDVRIYVEADATVPGGVVIRATAPDEQQPADVVTAEQQQPSVADADTPVGRIDVWLTAWKRYFGTLGLPFGADLIAGPPPSAEPRVSADDFGVVLEVLAVVLAERARSATAEQQQDGAVGRIEAFLTAWRHYDNDGLVSSECQPGETRKYAELTDADLRAVLAERAALAARVAELESERTSLAVLLLAEPDEREADTRAVAEACSDFGNDEGPRGIRQLYARFADRIAALDADTDGGAQ